MGVKSARSAHRIPGRLVTGATSLTGSFPYGGTELGLVRDCAYSIGSITHEITAEEWGGTPAEVLYGGEKATFACFLRAWDVDAIQAAIPHATAGGSGQALSVFQPGASDDNTFRPGRRMSPDAVQIVFCPRAPDRHLFVVLYAAVASTEASAAMQLKVSAEAGIAVVFRGLLDDSGRCAVVGRREDITL